LRGVFITVRYKVPLLASHERGKESSRVLAPDDLGVLGKESREMLGVRPPVASRVYS
jgi:hypothetical protein